MNTCSLTIMDVRNANFGRISALRKYVSDSPRLWEEFCESVNNDALLVTTDWCLMELDMFIERKGITVLKEYPFVTFDKEKNQYRVDVIYTIEMK